VGQETRVPWREETKVLLEGEEAVPEQRFGEVGWVFALWGPEGQTWTRSLTRMLRLYWGCLPDPVSVQGSHDRDLLHCSGSSREPPRPGPTRRRGVRANCGVALPA
jgi:hypothetical protein